MATSSALTQVEVDVGNTPQDSPKFTITDAAVTATSAINAYSAGVAATGRQADENEMDPFYCVAIPGNGSFTLVLGSQTPIAGKYRVNYTVSA